MMIFEVSIVVIGNFWWFGFYVCFVSFWWLYCLGSSFYWWYWVFVDVVVWLFWVVVGLVVGFFCRLGWCGCCWLVCNYRLLLVFVLGMF